MHIQHVLFCSMTLFFSIHVFSMDLYDIVHNDNHIQWIKMPEDIWLSIIAQCEAKDTLRKTCTYFRDIASTCNKEIFLQNPLILSSKELLNDFALYYTELGNDAILSNLLANGADANTQDTKNKSLLYYAAKSGNLKAIDLLLKHPTINTTKIADNTQGIADGTGSPFHIALARGYLEIARRILSVNNVDVLLPLRYAIERNHVDMVTYILSMDIPVEYFEEALFVAARWDRVEIIPIVLSHNVNINCSQKFDLSTPLYVAVAHGNLSVLQLLVKHGATINITADSGRTPLYKAIEKGCVNIARFLIDQGADIHVTGGPYHYSLLVAAFTNNKKTCIPLIQLLAGKGIDVNRKYPTTGNVALHDAVKGSCFEVVQLLLKQPDIMVNQINNSNETPLDVTYRHYIMSVMTDFLIARGGKTFDELKKNGAVGHS